jgi:chemotaxis response regulator CheB
MGEAAKIRVFSVDDHPLLNEAIAAIINSQPAMQLVAKATSGSDAVGSFVSTGRT